MHTVCLRSQFWDPQKPQIKGPVYSKSSNLGDDSQLPASTTRSLAHISQFVPNAPSHSFQNPGYVMANSDHVTPVAGVLIDARHSQTQYHPLFGGNIRNYNAICQALFAPSEILSINQLHESIPVNIPNDHLQSQRKRRPSTEVGTLQNSTLNIIS